ncbi:MAG: TerB family tellurite resistance protein, partial [Bacteroidia bacterium]|nr:TerB family tellurite resistance protein [Bacteroidia bacterium]
MSQSNFLNQSEEVKTAYLVTMVAISTADRENTAEEVAFVDQMSAEAGLLEDSQAKVREAVRDSPGIDLNAQLEQLKDNEIKFALLTDLLNLSYADGELEKEEVDAIRQIQAKLEVSDEQFDALEKYVKEANKEVEDQDGNAVMTAVGQPKEVKQNFLERVGLMVYFKK